MQTNSSSVFHPIVWWISKDIRRTREELCDDTVLEYFYDSQVLKRSQISPPAAADARLIYSEALINVQRLFLSNKNNFAMKFQHSEDSLTNRIQRLFDQQYRRERPKRFFNLYLLVLVLFLALGSFAFTKFSYPTVSIAADRMNVLYLGVENPITVAVAGVPTEDTKVESDDIKLKDKGNGHFLAVPSRPGHAIIRVRGRGNVEQEVMFRVKRIPAPVARLGNRNGGNITASRFQESKGLQAVLENFDYDARCVITNYHLTRVGKNADPIESINVGGAFNEKSKELVAIATSGDIYYIDQVNCKCPGDEMDRPINSLVFKIQ